MNVPHTFFASVLTNVLFPAFSQAQGDPPRLARGLFACDAADRHAGGPGDGHGARRQLLLPVVLPQLRMLPANRRGDRDGMRVDRRPVLLLSCPIRRGSVVGMWESRVSEISKSLWKPFSGFHRDVISITVFAVTQG